MAIQQRAVGNQQNVKPRHVYSACTVGVGAVLTLPALAQPAESWAASSLPIIGGRSASEARNVVWPTPADYAQSGLPDRGPVLRFGLARTEITGTGPQPGPQAGQQLYTTIIKKKVTALNILDRVKGDIDVTLTFVYTENPRASRPLDTVTVSVVSNLPGKPPDEPFAGIVIIGAALPTIKLTAGIYQSAGQDFRAFRGGPGPQSIDQLRPNTVGNPDDRHHKQAHGGPPPGHGHGVIFTSLAESHGPNAPLNYDPFRWGRADLPGAAGSSVYFGEWHGEPYHQSFTLLRVKLENVQQPNGAFTGEIVIDDDENGHTYP